MDMTPSQRGIPPSSFASGADWDNYLPQELCSLFLGWEPGGASARVGEAGGPFSPPTQITLFECSPYASAPGILQGDDALWISRVGEEGWLLP